MIRMRHRHSARTNRPLTERVRDSEVEDSKLSLQIKDVGYSTKISSRARAFVGPMTNLRSLHGQQVKWNFGAIDLLWPGTRGYNKGQPLHPNLRLRWFENVSMLFNIGTRMAFVLLLAAALSIHAFVFNPIWLIPPVVAAGLNLRLAMSMVESGVAVCVPGNHDMNLLRKLKGGDVQIAHGLAETLAQLEREPREFRHMDRGAPW